jgi:hypothetical protein
MRTKLILAAALCTMLLLPHLFGANISSEAKAIPQYITIRWAGRDNTHIIRPGGKVEFVGIELRKVARPDRTDEKSFYMNIVMNGLTKDGWEFAGMTNDEIVMKRATP